VKFGGSSLANCERIAAAAKTIAKKAGQGVGVVVVVSAIGKTTDQLLGLIANKKGNSISQKDLDDILAMGERTSVRVFAAALKSEGLHAKYFDPSDEDWPIITDEKFSDANPIVNECHKRITQYVIPILDAGIIPVIAGFIGRTISGKVTTIGRGGSDTTALILARAINAEEVVLVTNTDGIMTADPKIIPDAKQLDMIDVVTLMKLADSGTKFIHRKALRFKDPDIPVRVVNQEAGDLDAKGTIITGGFPREIEVTMASQEPCLSATLAGEEISSNPHIIQKVVEETKKTQVLGLSADLDSMILYLPEKDSDSVLAALHRPVIEYQEAKGLAVRKGLAFLKIRGVGLEDTPGIISKVSGTLRENGINIFGIFTVASSILLFVSWEDRVAALKCIENALR
jgi:aspartate kinase